MGWLLAILHINAEFIHVIMGPNVVGHERHYHEESLVLFVHKSSNYSWVIDPADHRVIESNSKSIKGQLTSAKKLCDDSILKYVSYVSLRHRKRRVCSPLYAELAPLYTSLPLGASYLPVLSTASSNIKSS